MKTVKVVGAVIVDNEGKILVAQRPYSEITYKSYKWEFPGGKIDENETSEEALSREIREELDCDITIDKKIGSVEYDYPDFRLMMDLFLCSMVEGSVPLALEHHAIKWVNPEDLPSLDWLEADYEILPVIQKYLM